MASPGSSVGDFSAHGTRPGVSGYVFAGFTIRVLPAIWVFPEQFIVYRIGSIGLRQDVRSYLASCAVCLAWKSPCPRIG